MPNKNRPFRATGRLLSQRLVNLGINVVENVRTRLVNRDERRKALEASEHQFRSLAENLPDNIARWDCSGRYLYINPVHERTLRKPAEEVIGTRIPESYDRVVAAIARVVATGEALPSVRQTLRSETGEWRMHEVSLTPERDQQGRIASVLGVGRDVTRQAQTEEALAASERQFRTLAENLPNYLARHTTRAEIIYQNPRLEAFCGRKIHDVVGKTPTQAYPHGRFAEYERALLETARTGNERQMELRFTTETGRQCVHHVHLVAERDETGVVSSVQTIGFDITEQQRAAQHLKHAVDFAEGIIAAIPDILFEMDRDGRYLNVWTKNADMLAGPADALIGRTVGEVLPARQAVAAMQAIREADEHGVAYGHMILVDLPDGSHRWFEHSLAKKPGATPATDTFLVLSRDVTERKQIEDLLASRELEFRTLVEHSPDTIARYDKAFRRVYANPTFASLVAGGEALLIGKKPSECPGGPHTLLYEQKLGEVFASGKAVEFELNWKEKDGAERCHLIKMAPEPGVDNTVEHVLAVGRDISELHVARQKIHQMAYYDPLTGLPNRALFSERLRQILGDGSTRSQLAGVMMIDMDRFKGINDTMGHAAGDELLRDAARRLSTSVRPGDIVARFGGDEFAIALPAIGERRALEDISRTILSRFDERFVLNGKDVFVSCSIGIALSPVDGIDVDGLMKYADSAMYSAKRSGRRGFCFYSKDLTVDATAHLLLESELHRAIERGEFELHYQPKVSFVDNEVVGSEALMRWMRPGVGLVPPSQFIPITEESGLIVELGKWALREACRTAAEWNIEGAALHKVAVNLSARQFQYRGLARMVADILDETGCRPEWLELEITESLLLDENDTILATLSAFKAMGLSIAIDDFGTGYSALSYLARFPIDTLKIDKSFIQQATTSRRHAELVKAILSIAQCLGQQVVAEGVETVGQAAFLEANGCQVAQGFLYCKPLPKPEMARLPRYLRPNATSG